MEHAEHRSHLFKNLDQGYFVLVEPFPLFIFTAKTRVLNLTLWVLKFILSRYLYWATPTD